MKKFLFLFVFSFMCANGLAQVPNGPTTPVPPVPAAQVYIPPSTVDLPITQPPAFVPPSIFNIPFLNPPAFVPPSTFNIPFLNPPLVPVPDPIGNNEPPLLTQSYCNDLRNQIYEIQSELMPLYFQFNAKRTTISGTKEEIKEIDELIDELTSQVIILSLQNKPVPADLRNHISNRVNWRVWLQERINRIEDEIVPIERDINFWESFLPELEESMRKAGC